MPDSARARLVLLSACGHSLGAALGVALGMPWPVAVACVAAGVGAQLYLLYNRHDVMRDRRRNGLCVRCGYDLRGMPRRCPECGLDRQLT